MLSPEKKNTTKQDSWKRSFRLAFPRFILYPVTLFLFFLFSFEQITLALEIPLSFYPISLKSNPAFSATRLGESAVFSGGEMWELSRA